MAVKKKIPDPVVNADDYIRNAELIKVVDGDTIEIRIDLGFNAYLVERLRLRLVDAPEMNTPAGKAWKEWVQNWFKSVRSLYVKTIKYEQDKYARYLADVVAIDLTTNTVRNLVEEMLVAGCPRSKYK